MINKDTQVCISISAFPGNTGTTIHNLLYKKFKLNFVYKSFGVDEDNLCGVISGIRALKIRGCSVSMPFKNQIIQYLDVLTRDADALQVVNTIVNDNGSLIGHNTDIFGATQVIESIMENNDIKSVLIVGAGSTARSVALALKNLGFDSINVMNRTRQNAHVFANFMEFHNLKVNIIEKISPHDLIINCTSIGMQASDIFPISDEILSECSIIFDVVNKRTNLIRRAERHGKIVYSGKDFAIYQALRQFELYTLECIDYNNQKKFIELFL